MSDKNTENNENIKPRGKKLPPSFWRRLGISFSVFAAIVLVLMFGLGYYGLFVANKDLAASLVDLKNSVDQTNNAVSQTQKNMSDLQQITQQLSSDLKTQNQALDDVRKSQNNNKDDLIVAEANYLVKIANDNLQFDHNIPLAQQLLNSADQAIASLNDPKLYTVREAIAADLATLQRVPQIDVAGLYLQLDSLSEQLDKLPMANKFITTLNANADANDANLAWWRRGLRNTWQALQHVVIVRRNQTGSLPFMTPDQQVFLAQNLHAEIEQTKWALLHQQENVYRSSLQQVANWITQYVAQDAPVTKQVLASITKLQQVDIKAVPLNVENSLQAFQAYVKGR